MPPEGQNKIEQLLREHAGRRRTEAGAPIELHPATRRVLQGEVTRQFPATAPRRPWHYFATRLWPRLSLGVTSLAIVAVVGWAVASLWDELPGVGNENVRQAKLLETEVEKLGRKKSDSLAAADAAKKSEADSEQFNLSKDGLGLLKEGLPPASGNVRSPFEIVDAGDAAKIPAAKPSGNLDGEFRGLGDAASDVPGGLGGGALGYGKEKAVAPLAKGEATSELRQQAIASSKKTAPAGADPQSGAGYALTDSFSPNAVAGRRAPGEPAAILPGPVAGANSPLSASAAPQKGVAYFFESYDAAGAKPAGAARFSKLVADSDKRAKDTVPAVLSTFELRRDARNIRIIDADGSAYEGQLVPAVAQDDRAERLEKSTPTTTSLDRKSGEIVALSVGNVAESKAAVAVPQSWFFRASGTNRTLKQLVTITGSMSGSDAEFSNAEAQKNKLEALPRDVFNRTAPAATATAPPVVTAPVVRGSIRADEPAQAIAPQLQGKFRIGTGPERDLNAIRVNR